jgi:hypothetical protein
MQDIVCKMVMTYLTGYGVCTRPEWKNGMQAWRLLFKGEVLAIGSFQLLRQRLQQGLRKQFVCLR